VRQEGARRRKPWTKKRRFGALYILLLAAQPDLIALRWCLPASSAEPGERPPRRVPSQSPCRQRDLGAGGVILDENNICRYRI
jgi:hypothetical protein